MKKREPIANTLGCRVGLSVDGLPAGLGDDGASILAQEAQGTREVASAGGTRLPMRGTTDKEDAERCKAVGIMLGAPIPGDNLFREATLPEGWTTAPSSEDARTTHIFDSKRNVRGYIWYKAAFYDRAAYMWIYTRYWIETNFPDASDTSVLHEVVRDRVTGEALWESPVRVLPGSGRASSPQEWSDYEALQKKHHGDVVAWLDATFPEWRNPAAYWDAE